MPFKSLEKFKAIDVAIIHNVLQIVVDKIENSGLQITISFHFFEKYAADLKTDFNLLAKAYLQQERISNSFDYNRNELKALVELDNKFLLKYIETFYGDKDWLNRNIDN